MCGDVVVYELVSTLRRTNPTAPARGLRPTNPNALSQVSTQELLLELMTAHHRPPRQTTRHLGRLGWRSRPARRLGPTRASSTLDAGH
jgi:hypothetical protein